MIGSGLALMSFSFMDSVLFIFLVSAVLRLIVVLIGQRFLQEVRHVEEFSSEYLVREFAPVEGIVREVHHLEHMVKKVEHAV